MSINNIYLLKKIPSPFAEAWHNFKKNILASVGLVGFCMIVIVAITSPIFAPYDPSYQHSDAYLVEPSWSAGGRPAFIFGTDDLGRDLFSRILVGAQLTLGSAVLSTLLSLVMGLIIGVLSALSPRPVRTLLMRIMDIMLAVPSLLIAILLTSLFNSSLIYATFAVTVALTPHFARYIQQAVEEEISKPYVQAAILDVPNIFRTVFRSIFPNLVGKLAVHTTLSFSVAILDIAALGFLGLGAHPSSPEWGTLLSESLDYIQIAPWTVTLPGIAIFSTVLFINLIGQGLSYALDPQQY